jgi:large subunit ribosomal protein L10
MPTQKKIELVEEYSQKFKESKSIFLADFSGINVANTINLRRSFRKAEVEYYVIKNTLAKRSLQQAGIEGLDDMLVGMTAFAFSTTDAVAPIKVIKEFNKSQPKERNPLVIKGCLFEGKVLGPDQVEVLSSLPSREVLLAQFVGMLQSPIAKLMSTLQGTGQKLLAVLEQVKTQKS